MAFTLTCHVCGQKLTLFDLDVKKRKGTIRCNHCGAKISYDLDKRKIQESGFWAQTEPAFDSRAKNRLMNQLKREEARKEGNVAPVSSHEAERAHDFDNNPFASKAGFAKFDLKTGQIVTEDTKPAVQPIATKKPEREEAINFKVVDKRHQKRTIRAARSSVPSMRKKEEITTEKTFTPPPRVVTRSAHRNMTLVRQAQKAQQPKQPVQISKVQSWWQRIKSFFGFHK